MFIAALNWLIANTPAFLRPGVNWLVTGVRKITGHIAALWNILGVSVGFLYSSAASLRTQIMRFVVAAANAAWWLKNVYIPARLNSLLMTVVGLINSSAELVRGQVMSWLLGLDRWVRDRVAELVAFALGVRDWAASWLARLDAVIDALIRALAPMLAGPRHLAEWLAGEMWRALLRRVHAERDRIAQWVLRESMGFAVWLARQIEDVIVRLL